MPKKTTEAPALVGITPLTLWLPLPPSLNNSYPTVRGRRVPSPDLKAFWKEARRALIAQGIPQGTWSQVPAVGYDARIYVPTRSSDGDNRVKHWLDFVANWLGFQDNHVEDWHVVRRLDRARPRVEINLFEVRQAQPGDL